MTRSALLFGCSLLAACATVNGPGAGSGRRAVVDLEGSLALSDGAPVAGAEVTVRCGAVEQAARSDEAGRFLLRQLPEGDCWLSAPAAGLARTIRASAGLFGGRLDLRLPPVHRLVLEWSDRKHSGRLVLDETVPHPLRIGPMILTLRSGSLVAGEAGARARLARPVGDLVVGQRLLAASLVLTVRSIERRPWMPIALRRPARTPDALGQLPLLGQDGQLVRPVLGVRTLVLGGSCEQLRSELLDELETLVATHDGGGLRGLVILTEACGATNGGAHEVLLGGPEAQWALGTRAGEVAVLDGAGRVLQRAASLEEVRAFLARSWPVFAAASRVSVAPSASVLEAEAERLLTQARAQGKAGRHREAHQLLDRVLAVTPDLAEARKERALIKARLGDLGGALREVTWWRTSFGAESADDLLDELEHTARVSTLH